MNLTRKKRKIIEQGEQCYRRKRLEEKLKIHKEHYLQLIKENLLPNDSRKLVYFQLQKLLKQISILERRERNKNVFKKQ